MEEVALSRTFGAEAGGWFQRLIESKGVEFHGGEELDAFEGDGRVSAVVTKSGLSIECDLVVVGAGVRADAMLAQRAGLEVDDGIVCDSKLRTSVEGIYAAGDCCSYDSVVHGRRLRVEHWDVAMQQGIHAAGNMLGDDRDYEVVPYFFSDLADWAGLEYVGPAVDWDEEVWRGDRDKGEFSVWYLQGRSRRRRPQRRSPRRPRRSPPSARRRRRRLRRPRSHRRRRQRPFRDRRLRVKEPPAGYPFGSALRPGVMAAHLSLEEAVGVRVPGPQL